MIEPGEQVPWAENFVVLGVGIALIVGVASVWSSILVSAVWRRALWQAAIVACWGITIVELCGVGRLTTHWLSHQHEVSSPREDYARIALSGKTEHWNTDNSKTLQHVPKPPVRIHQSEILSRNNLALREFLDSAVPDASIDFVFRELDSHSYLTLPTGIEDAERPDGTGQSSRAQFPEAPPAARAHSVVFDSPWIASSPELVSASRVWLGVWGAGTIILACWLLGSRLVIICTVSRFARVLDPALEPTVRNLTRQLGGRRRVRLVESQTLRSPVAFGILRPTIALPTEFCQQFSRDQQRAILAHEVSHLVSADPAWRFAAELLRSLVWWHPAVWIARARLHAECERAADMASLLVPDGAARLAECLLTFGKQMQHRLSPIWVSVEGSGLRSALGRRVESLLGLKESQWRKPHMIKDSLAKSTVSAALVAAVVFGSAWVRPQAVLAKGAEDMSFIADSWRQSLAGTALALLMGSAPPPASAEDVELDVEVELELTSDEDRNEEVIELAFADEEERERREVDQREERERHEREERERADRRGPEELHHELRELERHVGQLREERARLDDDQDEEAHELDQALRAARRRIEETRDRIAEQGQMVGRRVRDQLEHRAQELRHRLRELGDAHPEETQQIRETLGRIMDEMRERGDAGRAGLAQLERRFGQLREQIAEAREVGRVELARRLEQTAERVAHDLRRMREPGPRDERPGGEPHRRDQKIEHVRNAIEHLHAAGLHDEAEHLVRKLESELHRERDRPRNDFDSGFRPDERHERDEHRQEHAGPLQDMVARLHAEMDQMRRDMEEMRKAIREVMAETRRRESR